MVTSKAEIFGALLPPIAIPPGMSVQTKQSLRKMMNWAKKKLHYFAFVLCCGVMLSVAHISNVSSENTYDRIQAGQWVVASMYWEDKLVSTGKNFDPIGWHAAHRTLPIGTLIRVSNPKNHRSITVTINDRGPFTPDRDLDLSLGAGALLGFKGLGTVYMEVLSIPPVNNIKRPIVESLFAVNDANANCVGQAVC
jgi:rare lipoprotein A (peptidoglycan hydrolase)